MRRFIKNVNKETSILFKYLCLIFGVIFTPRSVLILIAYILYNLNYESDKPEQQKHLV